MGVWEMRQCWDRGRHVGFERWPGSGQEVGWGCQVPGALCSGQPNSVALQARRSTRQLVQRPPISRTLWLDPSLVMCRGQGPLNNAALTGGCGNSVQHEVSAVLHTRPLHRKCSDMAVNNSA